MRVNELNETINDSYLKSDENINLPKKLIMEMNKF